MNSGNEKQAIMATRKELRENRIPFDITDNSLRRCLQRFDKEKGPFFSQNDNRQVLLVYS